VKRRREGKAWCRPAPEPESVWKLHSYGRLHEEVNSRVEVCPGEEVDEHDAKTLPPQH